MTIKPEERPKLIALVVALLGVVIYVIVVLVPKITAGAAPAPAGDPPPALTSAAAAPANAGAAGSGEASAALPDEDNLPVPPSPSRDTFTPPTASGHPALQTPAPVQVKPAALSGRVGLPGSFMSGPNQIIQPPAGPPMPPVELKGIILGEPAIAVLSVNGAVVQRQVGETIAPGLKLAAITDAGISVLEGKKRISVAVGHMMAATGSTGQKP